MKASTINLYEGSVFVLSYLLRKPLQELGEEPQRECVCLCSADGLHTEYAAVAVSCLGPMLEMVFVFTETTH